MLGRKQLKTDGYKLGNKRTDHQRFGNKYIQIAPYHHNHIQIEADKPFQSPLEKPHTQHKMWHN